MDHPFSRTSHLGLALLLSVCCGCGPSPAQESPAPAVPATPALTAIPPAPHDTKPGLNVLFIGDSNTEIGHVTGGLDAALEAKYGYSGSGYRSLAASVGNGAPTAYRPYLLIENNGAWKALLSGEGDGRYAPDGNAVQSDDPNAETKVRFYGDSVRVFYLRSPAGGTFAAALDGGAAQTVDSAAGVARAKTVQKPRQVQITANGPGWHTLSLKPVTGKVTLLGVTTRNGAGAAPALVHKWGRSGMETRYFLGLEESDASSVTDVLQPDVCVLMLGTNDHNISMQMATTYAHQEAQLVARLHRLLPKARVLVLSTIPIGVYPSDNLRQQYRELLPEVAKQAGADYFDLAGFLGGTSKAVVEAGYAPANGAIHFDAVGGKKVGAKLLETIEALGGLPAPKLAEPPFTTKTGSLQWAEVQAAIPPPVLAQITLWLSADGPLQLDKSGRVARWDNLRPDVDNYMADVYAEQLLPAKRPLWQADGGNGHPALQFDGKSSHLVLNRTVGGRAYSVVLKARSAGGAIFGEGRSYYRFFGPGPDNSNRLFNDEVVAGMVKANTQCWVNGKLTPPDKVEYPLQGYALLTIMGSNIRTIGHNQTFAFYVPKDQQREWNVYWDGDIAEVVLYANVFDDQRRTAVESFLAKRYNFALAP